MSSAHISVALQIGDFAYTGHIFHIRVSYFMSSILLHDPLVPGENKSTSHPEPEPLDQVACPRTPLGTFCLNGLI